MSAELSNIVVREVLPCGCVLHLSVVRHTPPEPGWVTQEAAKAEYWLQDRMPRHECALVSTDNINGLRPVEKRKQAA